MKPIIPEINDPGPLVDFPDPDSPDFAAAIVKHVQTYLLFNQFNCKNRFLWTDWIRNIFRKLFPDNELIKEIKTHMDESLCLHVHIELDKMEVIKLDGYQTEKLNEVMQLFRGEEHGEKQT